MNDIAIASLILLALIDEDYDGAFTAAELWPVVRHAIDPRPTVAEVDDALQLLADPEVAGVLALGTDLYRAAPDLDEALVRLYAFEDDRSNEDEDEDEDDGDDPWLRPAFADADDRY